jgi:predicted dehydrogenase
MLEALSMIHVALIGAGSHSCANHAPSLKRYVELHPGRISLDAVCDLDAGRASKAAASFGFQRTATSIDGLFGPEMPKLDALVAILPIPAMAEVTPRLFARGLPMVIEKPLGWNLSEADGIIRAARQAGMEDRVMVSMNRRYDPALTLTRDWLRKQSPIRYVRAWMVRCRRTEPEFVWGTGLHIIDALTHLAGPLALRGGACVCPARSTPDTWRVAMLDGPGGLKAVLEIAPAAGELEEKFRVSGDGYQVDVTMGSVTPWHVRAVKEQKVELDEGSPAGEPGYISNGAYAETAAFLDALVEGKKVPPPGLADVMESSRLAARIEAMG